MHGSGALCSLPGVPGTLFSLQLGDLPGTEEPMFSRPVHLIFALGWNSEWGRVNYSWTKVSLSRRRPWAEWIRYEELQPSMVVRDFMNSVDSEMLR